MESDTSARPARRDARRPDPIDLETALGNAEQFIVKSAERVHPDLSVRTLMRYVDQYRTHLCEVVASIRHEQGLVIGHSVSDRQGR
jgi:hypothetical protein